LSFCSLLLTVVLSIFRFMALAHSYGIFSFFFQSIYNMELTLNIVP
jgi:hypothetical protein